MEVSANSTRTAAIALRAGLGNFSVSWAKSFSRRPRMHEAVADAREVVIQGSVEALGPME